MDISMIKKYIEWLKTEGKGKKTINEYPIILQKLIQWYEETEGNEFKPDKVTTLHMHEFVSHLKKVKQYDPSYINKIIASLKTFYRFAMESKLVTFNPMLKVKIQRSMKQQEAPKWMTKLELSKFKHAIETGKNEKKKVRDMAICSLMSEAGLRVQEVSDLNIIDICLEKRRENVTVRDGKGGKYRVVPLNRDLIGSIEGWMQYRKKSNYGENEPLFLSERNLRPTDRTIRYMVTEYAKDANLEAVSPHSLRHTFGKNLADTGVRLEQIAYLMGHDSLESTRVYLRPSNDDLRKNVDLISEKR
jgi:integrase/recombinase XerC